MDFATGQVLADSNANERVEPASITKVMIAYVVSAELAAAKIKLDDQVSLSARTPGAVAAPAPKARPAFWP